MVRYKTIATLDRGLGYCAAVAFVAPRTSWRGSRSSISRPMPTQPSRSAPVSRRAWAAAYGRPTVPVYPRRSPRGLHALIDRETCSCRDAASAMILSAPGGDGKL